MNIDDILKRPEFSGLDKNLATSVGSILTLPSLSELNKYLDLELKKTTNDEILTKLVEVFEDYNSGREWFYTDHLLFKKRPYDICKEGKPELILNELYCILYGTF
jgi:hypothetical protein